MRTEEFFVIDEQDSKGAFNAFINLRGVETLKLFRSEVHPEKPIDLTWISGSKFFDLLSAGNGMNLYSARIFKVFEENNITGWDRIACKIHTGKREIRTDYSLLTVTGRCGFIDYSKSEKIVKQPFPPKGAFIEVKRGLHFDITKWDGTDIFTPDNTLFIFITEHVKALLDKNKFTNIKFTNLVDFEIY
jgi:hypothetical protein